MPLYMRMPSIPEMVEAEQIAPGGHAHPQANRPARPGDWVVTNHATGQVTVLTSEEFAQQYTAAPVPQHMLATGNPTPGPQPQTTQPQPVVPPDPGVAPEPDQAQTGGEAPYDPYAPDAARPASVPGQAGDSETFAASGPTTPMNEAVEGRPAPTPEVRPRMDEPGPVESPTGLPEQPGDADKAFHEGEQAPA